MEAQNQFKVSVQNMYTAAAVKGGSFTTKQDANKFKNQLKKQFNLINHGGYIVNYNTRLELNTNY